MECRCVLVALALGGSGLVADTNAPADAVVITPAYISQLAEGLRTNHPAVRAATARAEAARAGVNSARTWEDPMLRLGGMFSEEEMRAEDGDLIYGLEQKLPLFGKPKLARQVAQADLATEEAAVEFEFQSRRRDLARAVFRAGLAERVVAIGTEDLLWLERMVQTTGQRYRAGDSTLVELLRLENEQHKQADKVRTDQLRLKHEHLVLNRILNRDLAAPWPSLRLPAVAGPVVYDQRLVEFAQRFEPGLKVRRQQIQQAEAVSRLARRERLPEFTLDVLSRNYTGNGDFRQAEVMLGFTFPWGNTRKYRSAYDQARARATAAEQDAADYALGLQEEIHQLTVGLDAARREALLYRDDILPRAERALESAQAAWAANRGMFLDVMEARRMVLEARLMEARAVAEQYDQLSELVLCCGLGDLEALSMIGAQPASSNSPSPAP